MQGSTMKKTVLAIAIASALSLVACGDGTPTSPTQAGQSASALNADTPITVGGVISRMSRSGPDGLDVVFRVGDEVFMRGDAHTTASFGGSLIYNTSALREGQIVTVDARQRADHVYAKHVVVN